MVKVPDEIIEKIKKFIEEVEKHNIRVEQAVLYGSYATGRFNEWSDIDIAVVSEDFTGIRFIDYDNFIKPILKSDSAIEPIAWRPEDFTIENPFAEEILRYGIRIV